MLVPHAVNERWWIDFMGDQLANGRRFPVLNLVDDYSRDACCIQIVDFSIEANGLFASSMACRGRLPKTVVCDNGPEFTSKTMFFWAKGTGVKLHFLPTR
jgi:putative transposase